MSWTGLTLLVPDKPDPERDALAGAWEAGGGSVQRLARFWEPPEALVPATVRLYGNDTFCLVLAQKLGLSLVEPAEDLLLRVDASYLGRHLWGPTLEDIKEADYPLFAKPAAPKLFRAGVFSSWSELEQETQGLAADTKLLASEVVEFDAEVRAFVLGGEVLTCALYEGTASLEDARLAVSSWARTLPLPRTCVLDVGHIRGRGWGLVEANASWGAGLNGCDPVQAARCIAAATEHAGGERTRSGKL